MAGILIRRFPDPSLDRASRPWTRDVEDRIGALEKAATRQTASELNANKAQNSSIDLVSRNIVDLDQRVQDAINSILVAPSQVTPGTFPSGVLIPGSQISGGGIDVTTVNAELYADNVTFNITTARVANWARTSDGFIATATSSRRFKTQVREVEWPDEKIEAIVSMALVYYRWIANVAERDRVAALPPEDPDHGKFVPNPLEIGFIAEEMHARGLWEFVAYERHPDDTLILDDDGEPIPFSIHYTNWSLALHEVTRRLWNARKADRADIDTILAHLGLPSAASAAE